MYSGFRTLSAYCHDGNQQTLVYIDPATGLLPVCAWGWLVALGIAHQAFPKDPETRELMEAQWASFIEDNPGAPSALQVLSDDPDASFESAFPPEESCGQDGQVYTWSHSYSSGVNVGVVSSPVDFVSVVGGRSHSQSRVALGRVLGLKYAPRDGERLEISGPCAVHISNEEWDLAMRDAECQHRGEPGHP